MTHPIRPVRIAICLACKEADRIEVIHALDGRVFHRCECGNMAEVEPSKLVLEHRQHLEAYRRWAATT